MDSTLKLIMTFKSEGDKNVNFTIDDPRSNLSEDDVIEAMNLILEKNIFCPGEVDLKEAIKAKVVQTETTEYNLQA
ncbi:DUF2922 domain-containing protein [Romboutsia sp. 1001713B170207_170306_H8]|uniref:DUF2922 domain-containing protein n=1 Tax=Romboutsia sp. 1001713B170207_170306_H8 TaxID=2787112 RepID=UPI0008225D62|nr:DUF2922 domain-containing protein [Romboutsia sp. 1001713B170207_170306_H8]SCI44430.1 Protein of uncharacterised function (DUF2922) [uncultured Clostridium sp.]